MDSITHIVLGACVGEALLGRSIGKKAMLIGAVAQSIPDIDIVTSFWLNTVDDLVAHRGITHSFLFVLLAAPFLGRLCNHQIASAGWSRWTAFFLLEMLIHLFLDAFNNYGVGWFEPFSDYRVSFNTIYVADPLITIFPALATLILLISRGKTPQRKKWWAAALLLSACYLLVCIFNKLHIEAAAKKALALQNIPHNTWFTTPAPLQSFLWMVVAGDSSGYHVGYRSVFDKQPAVSFQYFPVNEQLLNPYSESSDIQKLKKFSRGFYTVEKWNDTLVFNDLRFGQIIGWHNPKERFVFHYFIQHPKNNELIVQRGRFARWDADVVKSFFQRISGK